MSLKENTEMTKKYSLLSQSVVKEKHNIHAIKYLILILKWADTVSIVFPQWKNEKLENLNTQVYTQIPTVSTAFSIFFLL